MCAIAGLGVGHAPHRVVYISAFPLVKHQLPSHWLCCFCSSFRGHCFGPCLKLFRLLELRLTCGGSFCSSPSLAFISSLVAQRRVLTCFVRATFFVSCQIRVLVVWHNILDISWQPQMSLSGYPDFPIFTTLFPNFLSFSLFQPNSGSQHYDIEVSEPWYCVCVWGHHMCVQATTLTWGAPRHQVWGGFYEDPHRSLLLFAHLLSSSPWPPQPFHLCPSPLLLALSSSSSTSSPSPLVPFFSILARYTPPSLFFFLFLGMIMACLYIDLSVQACRTVYHHVYLQNLVQFALDCVKVFIFI